MVRGRGGGAGGGAGGSGGGSGGNLKHNGYALISTSCIVLLVVHSVL